MTSETGLNIEDSTHSQEANTWLTRMTTGNLDENRFRAATRLSSDLIGRIEKEIEGNKFQVSETKKSFKLKQKQLDGGQERQGNFSQWKKIPGQGDFQQRDKSDDKQKNLHHSHSERKYFKSEMTQEEIQRIKQIKRAQRKHERQLQKKRQQFEENIKKLQEEEKQLLEKEKKEKNEQRMKEVAKKINQIRARQADRTRKMEEENRKIMELKHEKTLYLKLNAKYKSTEQEEERKKEELKQALKKQKLVNFDEIKEHQKKYDDIMRSQKEERQKKMGDLTRINSKKYYQPKFLRDQIIEETKMARVEHLQKKNEVMERYNTQKDYAEMIRDKIMPTMVVKEEDKNNDKSQVPSVSYAEQFKMGNQYMKQAHQNLANLKGGSRSKLVEKKQEPFHYKDYLKDLRKDKKPTSHKENRYLEQINNVMKNENMTPEEKFYKAKLLTEKIEETKKGRKSQKLISSINAKLHLLKQIGPTQE